MVFSHLLLGCGIAVPSLKVSLYFEVTSLPSRFRGFLFSFGVQETVFLFFIFFPLCYVCNPTRMEELTKSWSCFTLSDREGSDLRITDEEAITEFVLAAKFLTKCALNIDAIAKTFTPLWRSKNGFKVTK